MPFVDQEYQLPFFFEGELQHFAFNLVDGFGGVFSVPLDAEMRAEGFQKTCGTFCSSVQEAEHREVGLFREGLHELTAKRTFPGADFAQDDVKPPL